MADQASVNSGRANGSGEGVVGSIAGFGNDVATLAELQAKLIALDLKESAAKATLPLSMAVVGLVVLVSAVPVVIVGVGLLVAQAFTISNALALLLTAVTFMVVAVLLVVFALRELRRVIEIFRRSREELTRNVSWLRTVLVHSGRPATKRRW